MAAKSPFPPLTVAVASGKGGTGKTAVAASLAVLARERSLMVTIVDGDADAPNTRLLLNPSWQGDEAVTVPTSVVNDALCTACGACADVCRFGAIKVLGRSPLVFAELCHGCGGCILSCPAGALHEEPRTVGAVRWGETDEGILLVEGSLDVGDVKTPQVIRAARIRAAALGSADLVLVDSPPGAACSVVAALTGADYLLLVTEPTPFGLHDLRVAVRLAGELGLPTGVLVNKEGSGQTDIGASCEEWSVPVLGSLPFERAVATSYAAGVAPILRSERWRQVLGAVLDELLSDDRLLPGDGPLSGDRLLSGDRPAPDVLLEERRVADTSPPPSRAKKGLARATGKTDQGEGTRRPASSASRDDASSAAAPRTISIMSGKGGTGKTTVAVALAQFCAPLILADADVEASNLHLVFPSSGRTTSEFPGLAVAHIDADWCVSCGECERLCRAGAVGRIAYSPLRPAAVTGESGRLIVDPFACEGCGVCEDSCPQAAIELVETRAGVITAGRARSGPFIWAELEPGADLSGRLVTEVRDKAELAGGEVERLILVDGPPGIGCPAIASVTNTDLVLAVAEPSPSGIADLDRLHQLTRLLGVPMMVLLNKADLDDHQARNIELFCARTDLSIVARIPFDPAVPRWLARGAHLQDLPDSLNPLAEVAAELSTMYLSPHV